MTDIRGVESLKREIEELKDKLSRSKGAIQQLKGVDGKGEQSVDAVKGQLIVLEQERIETEIKLNAQISKYKAAYKARFGRLPRRS